MALIHELMKLTLAFHFWALGVFLKVSFFFLGIILKILYRISRYLLRKNTREKIARFFRRIYLWTRRKSKDNEAAEQIPSYVDISEDMGLPLPEGNQANHPSMKGIEEMIDLKALPAAAAPESK